MRIAYLAEPSRQHAFPVEALLRVRKAPVFTTGKTLAACLPADTDIHVHPPQELGAALRAHGIDVVLSTSQLLSPHLLKAGHVTPRCVFIGHGESDKTHDAQLKERFVHNAVNAQFDLLLLATHAHFRDQRNPNKRLIGSLKHDSFQAHGYATHAARKNHVLWAPGWGRHNSARHFSARVLQTTRELGLSLDIHLHPHSYTAEPEVTRLVQIEMLRHEHVRVIQCADILPAMARSSLLLSDVSSVCYDWLLFDRPIVFLDHPGLSVAEEKQLFDVGVVATLSCNLTEILERELACPERLSQARTSRLAARFFTLDGHAAERALWEVERAAREDWQLCVDG